MRKTSSRPREWAREQAARERAERDELAREYAAGTDRSTPSSRHSPPGIRRLRPARNLPVTSLT